MNKILVMRGGMFRMWLTFALCMAIAIIVLYIPGLLLCRSLRFDAVLSVACAPVASVAAYAFVSIAYGMAGIRCSALTVLAPVLVVFVLVFVLSKSRNGKTPFRSTKYDWALLALYALVGLILCAYVFIKSLDGAASFQCRNDNITHLNTVRAFYESGIWSSLTVSNYLGTGLENASQINTGFYPAAWHSVVALVLSFAQCDVTIAVNAVNATVAGLVYPVSMFSLIRALFSEKRLVQAVGAFVVVGFTAFPWGFLIKGPLFPNLLSLSLLPAVLAAFVTLLNPSPFNKQNIAPLVVFALFSVIALALSQTNALFAAYLFGAAYLGHRLSLVLSEQQSRQKITLRKRIGLLATYGIVITAVWVAMYNVPALSNATRYELLSDVNLNLVNGIFNALSFSFMTAFPQWLLVAATFIGSIALIVRQRYWLLFPGCYFLIVYVFAKVFTGFPKMLLAGFWYSDPWRIASCAAIFLVPVAAVGLTTVIRLAALAIRRIDAPSSSTSYRLRQTAIAAIAVMLVFSCWNYFPNYEELRDSDKHTTPFGYVKGRISKIYSKARDQVYNSKEEAFVKEALSLIPEGSVVINMPPDGSIFSYGVDGMNTYYRTKVATNLTEDGALIADRLVELDTSPEVRDAVQRTGAKYVLLLDQGKDLETGKWLDFTKQSALDGWKGVSSITDETPGFKTILARDDMRLYEIEDMQ